MGYVSASNTPTVVEAVGEIDADLLLVAGGGGGGAGNYHGGGGGAGGISTGTIYLAAGTVAIDIGVVAMFLASI